MFVLAWLLFVPWADFFPIYELDRSWYMVLPWAWKSGADFGRDFIFTYGPWAFLFQGYEPSTFKYVVATWTLFTLGFVSVLISIARQMTRQRWTSALWMLLVICLAGTSIHGMQDTRIFLICWSLLILHFYIDDRPLAPAKVLLTLAMALACWGKFSVMMTSVLVLLAISCDQFLRKRKPHLLLIFLVTAAGLWLAAGQGPGGLVSYFRYGAMLAENYGQAMGVGAPTEARDLILYAAVAGLLLVCVLLIGRALIPTAALAVGLLLNFKVGYTRHDNEHEIWATTGLAILCLMYGAILWPIASARMRFILRFAVIGGVALCWYSVWQWETRSLPGRLLSDAIKLPTRAVHAASWLTGGGKIDQAYQQYLADLRATRPMPQATSSVDVYSYAQDVALAAGVEYRPRPTVQSYLAYTPELAVRNREFLQGDRAPQSILFQPQPIDSRYPSMEDGLSWPDLLSRYELKDARHALLLLARIANPRPYQLTEISKLTGKIDQWIDNPAPLELTWATIDLRPKQADRVTQMFYKPATVFIEVKTTRGSTIRFRLLPAVARGGFLLSPMVTDSMSFGFLASENRNELLREQLVAQFRITTVTWADLPGGYEPDFGVTFSRLALPSRDISQVPGVADYLRFRDLAKQINSTGQVRFAWGNEAPAMLMVSNPSSLLAPVRAGTKAIHIRFGIRWRELVPQENVAPIAFRLQTVDASGRPTGIVWQRTLNPASNPQDRIACDAEVDLPNPLPEKVLLETLPDGKGQPGQPYWAGIEFR